MASPEWHKLKMKVKKADATTAACACPCGYNFVAEAINEINLIFDDGLRRLRAICPQCGKLETVEKNCEWGGKSPAANRIDEYLL